MRAEDVWGGVLESMTFDVNRGELVLRIRVEDGGDVSLHELKFSGVRELRFAAETPLPWEYTEVTEFTCSKEADGSFISELVLWAEVNTLTVRSTSVFLDDERAPSVS